MPRRKDDRTPRQVAHDRKLDVSAHGRTAMQELAEREVFVRKNTARLRELRLAKEALEAPPAAPVTKTDKTKP